MERIAVIGSGIAGLAAARALTRAPGGRRVTLFEAQSHFGGHANTVDVTLNGVTHGVDTGFLVYNERTYPGLIRLFAEIGVETVYSEMSFSVQLRGQDLEWSGSNLRSVFAQPRNALRPGFWRMLADILRFNRLATTIALSLEGAAMQQSVAEFLDEHRFSGEFRDWYFLPMIGCIWSCPRTTMLNFPVATLLRFCHNHGLLQIAGRPRWLTLRGGSRQYVRRIVQRLDDARLNTPVIGVVRNDAGALVKTAQGTEQFDEVVFACHTNQALALLGADATPAEMRVLGAIRYQHNRAVLHTDTALLPQRRSAWAAWNYESAPQHEQVCLHYLLNRLQPLPWRQPVIVSLNPLREPHVGKVIQSFDYEHPIFDHAAIEAQRELRQIQGLRSTWFCGAWAGHGFHEDGLNSGLAVATLLTHPVVALRRGAA